MQDGLLREYRTDVLIEALLLVHQRYRIHRNE